MAMPQGRKRALATLSFPTRRLSVLWHLEVAGHEAAFSLILAPREEGAVLAPDVRGPFKSYTSRAAV